jgi:hypothetical protein
MLEKAWQVVANEYYDSHAAFSQAAWATALQDTLKVGGVHVGSLVQAAAARAPGAGSGH